MRGSQVVDDRHTDGDDVAWEEGLTEGPGPGAKSGRDWSNLWQMPTIIGAIILILLGLRVAVDRAPENDFPGAFAQIDRLIASGEFELAAQQLNEVIEPNLQLATPLEQGRFHATVADWIALAQDAENLEVSQNARRVSDEYTEAVRLGAMLDSGRLQRWALALIDVGDLDAARRRLTDLEALATDSSEGLDVRRRRNRVLRRLVEVSLRQEDLSFDALMRLLEDFRADRMLTPADELWAIARQARLRLEAGFPQQAVDHLLVELRRFEPKLDETPELSFGPLYTLLGRGYYDLGNDRYAEFHAERALEQFARSDDGRGDALVLLGEVAVTSGRWQEAMEYFDEVVRRYPYTPSGPAGLLGRAEVLSVLGEPDRSLADYRALGDRLASTQLRRDVNRDRVSRSLAGQHDNALTMGRLPDALGFIELAGALFEPGRIPLDILKRLTSTNRQQADTLLAEGRRAATDGEPQEVRPEQIDPAVRALAAEHYHRAAEYAVQHARRLAGNPVADEDWAHSLWLAADSYDLAGWHDEAVTHFTEYVAGRTVDDPRRPDAMFRLAQAYQAKLDCASAVIHYEQLIAEHPRSHVASRSHVPLARCYLALGRRPEAQQQLIQVLAGKRYLKPDAVDYRDALIELGTSYYQDGEYVRAIERLDHALRRYPDDPRLDDVRFRLADSHRRRAEELRKLIDEPVTPPGEQARIATLRREHLAVGLDLFGDLSRPMAGPSGRGETALLYQAQCAFELQLFSRAIELYEQVASHFPRHLSSLTALIQIVNCYFKLGDSQRADVAHRRALAKFDELPAEAFDGPDDLLDRAAWERWLRNVPYQPAGLSSKSR